LIAWRASGSDDGPIAHRDSPGKRKVGESSRRNVWHLSQVGVIKAFGTMAGPVKGDLPIPMIATLDIGDAAHWGKQRGDLIAMAIFVLGWTGMRGVVSLGAALALPSLLAT
jgi:NhaP-type Na+/H+ or K+/H+ antiporter